MVALDNSAIFGQRPAARLRVGLNALVGAIAMGAVLLVLGALLARGFADNGFRLGSQLAWRYTAFVFFAALVAAPLGRILARFFPGMQPPESLSRRLVWGFCASYGVYLVSVFLPNVIHLSAGATLMVLFGGTVAAVMAVSILPLKRLGDNPLAGHKVRRVLLGTAAIYFWSCYAVMALARISGPHRHDAFYEISLSLMLVALLVRYADRFMAHHDMARPAAMAQQSAA
jgi:hypothetical protein